MGFSYSDFASKATLSLLAASTTLILQRLLTVIYYRYWYSYLSGSYKGHNILNEADVFNLTIKYKDVRTLVLVGNGVWGFEGKNKGREYKWVSIIKMSSDIKDFGQGIYQYDNEEDCGVHTIQLNRAEDYIFLHVANTSHANDNKFGLILKRIQEKKPKEMTFRA